MIWVPGSFQSEMPPMWSACPCVRMMYFTGPCFLGDSSFFASGAMSAIAVSMTTLPARCIDEVDVARSRRHGDGIVDLDHLRFIAICSVRDAHESEAAQNRSPDRAGHSPAREA